MVGFGRTGKMWGFQHYPGLVPDIVTSAKGLSGAYLPISMVAMREEVSAVPPPSALALALSPGPRPQPWPRGVPRALPVYLHGGDARGGAITRTAPQRRMRIVWEPSLPAQLPAACECRPAALAR